MVSYQIFSGKLFQKQGESFSEKLVSIKSPSFKLQKTILTADGKPSLLSDVILDESKNKVYVLMDMQQRPIIRGTPQYAHNSDPKIHGWPISHAPRYDHVCFEYQKSKYQLQMRNAQNFIVKDGDGNTVMEIIHNGYAGGWSVDSNEEFSPAIILGIFIFTRYLDKENELYII